MKGTITTEGCQLFYRQVRTTSYVIKNNSVDRTVTTLYIGMKIEREIYISIYIYYLLFIIYQIILLQLHMVDFLF